MKRTLIILMTLAIAQTAMAGSANKDLGNPDKLRLTGGQFAGTEYHVSVQVDNDQDLTALDIPLRFGQPDDKITLDRVEWSDRVKDWEALTAQIDNEKKTVILGLISWLTEPRSHPELKPVGEGDPTIATLIFKTDGVSKPHFSTFTTEKPGHSLTFIYNRFENGKPYVEEFAPIFEMVDEK